MLGDTADLRTGAPLHDDLLALLPLVGVWAGSGAGVRPGDGGEFRFAQQISFVHDGRPFLAYESRTWIVDDDGNVVRPAAREMVFWRPAGGPNRDDVEVVLALNSGLCEILTGVAGDQRWELSSASITSAPSAKTVDGNRRLYVIMDGMLAYAQDLAPSGREYQPHLNAQLARQS